MVASLFLTTILLSVTGGLGYILLKLLVAVSGDRLSQSWRYHGIVAISLLFILPVYKLWAAIPVFRGVLPSITPADNTSELIFLPVSPSAGELVPQPAATEPGIDWCLAIGTAAVLWLLLASGLILWNVWRILRCRRLIEQTSADADSRLQRLAQDEAQLAGVCGEVRLLVSPQFQSPVLVGFFHPTILLPSDQLPDRDARLILAHELTHFRRKDLWKKLLVSTIQCVHWFNPIVYLLSRDFAYWLDTSCDEHVVSSLSYDQRKEYGHLLINYAPTSRHGAPGLYVSFASCRYKLKRRISTMLKSDKKSHVLTGLLLAVALVIGCLATSAMAANIAPASESRIDRDDATLMSPDDLQVAKTADWAMLINDLARDGSNCIFGDLSDIQVVEDAEWAMLTDDLARDGSNRIFCDLSDIQAVEDAEWASLIDDNTPAALSDDGIMPLARGSLASGKGYIYNSMYLTAGEVITLYATWSPSSAGVSIGLWNDANSVGIMKSVSNGSGSAQFVVTESGYFSLIIANTSAVSIDWDMSYVIE